MVLGTLLLLALGLAMDATAVAATRGLAVERIRLRHVVIVTTAFGGAQALMPAIGWSLGSWVGPELARWDHWIAFGLLAGIGGKMLWETRSAPEQVRVVGETAFGFRVMLLLAIATSIDALAAGISLPLLQLPLLLSVTVIGVVTALGSAAGLFAGRRFGALLGQRLEVVGGLVLIGIGTKTVVEHLAA